MRYALTVFSIVGWAILSPIAAKELSSSPVLQNLPEGVLTEIHRGYQGDKGVLAFSGIVYNHHRHKILAFGGGHATNNFPNSVHEFDLRTLKWVQLTEDVPPSAYSAENAWKTQDGKPLGGVKWKGKIWPGSRHTYGGLVVLPDRDLMVSTASQEFVGAKSRMPGQGKYYNDNYATGSGLFMFDAAKKQWITVGKTGLSIMYSTAEIDPEQPDHVYVFNSAKAAGFKLNTTTFEIKKLKPRPAATTRVYHSITYYPGRKSFLSFPARSKEKKGNIFEYKIKDDSWHALNPSGDAPNTYGLAVPYDSKNKVFSCVYNGFFYYYSPIENKWYKLDERFDVRPTREKDWNGSFAQHHIYDPRDNVHIFVANNWTTYAFKLSDAPGKLPGTGLR